MLRTECQRGRDWPHHHAYPSPGTTPCISMVGATAFLTVSESAYINPEFLFLLSISKLCPNGLRTVTHQASLFFIISQSLLKLISIELVLPSNRLILCCPLLLLPSIFPSIRVFSNKSALLIGRPNYWSFSFSISLPSKYSRLISQDWLVWFTCCLGDSLESSPAPQFESMDSSVLSLLYGPT